MQCPLPMSYLDLAPTATVMIQSNPIMPNEYNTQGLNLTSHLVNRQKKIWILHTFWNDSKLASVSCMALHFSFKLYLELHIHEMFCLWNFLFYVLCRNSHVWNFFYIYLITLKVFMLRLAGRNKNYFYILYHVNKRHYVFELAVLVHITATCCWGRRRWANEWRKWSFIWAQCRPQGVETGEGRVITYIYYFSGLCIDK